MNYDEKAAFQHMSFTELRHTLGVVELRLLLEDEADDVATDDAKVATLRELLSQRGTEAVVASGFSLEEEVWFAAHGRQRP